MSTSYELAFSVGPVQGFVAQSRRTRDLWAGSWLLSHLTECAIVCAEKLGGQVVLPARGDQDTGRLTSSDATVAGFPNTFRVSFTSLSSAQEAGQAASNAFRKRWRELAAGVWSRFVSDFADRGHSTQQIWDRQINNFWEICWCVGDDSKGLLRARKQFRSSTRPPEPGQKCVMMGDWQELSGWSGRGTRRKMEAFWEGVSERTQELDLEENERLCAVAFVKRFFPHLAEFKGAMSESRGWPSTLDLAASTWESALCPEQKAKLKSYRGRNCDDQRRTVFPDRTSDPEAFEDFRREFPDTRNRPQPFYALLLMDGDKLGELLSSLGGDEAHLSKSLATFSAEVPDMVLAAGGRTVYAGGDDVLVLAPAKGAVDLATKLSSHYASIFGSKSTATLSGALVFAHYKSPLRLVLDHAHKLLDEVAKEAAGRNALAVSVYSGNRAMIQWSAPWSVVCGSTGLTAMVRELAELEAKEGHSNAWISPSLLYRLRELLSPLADGKFAVPGEFWSVDPPELVSRLIASEMRRRGEFDKNSDTALQELVEETDRRIVHWMKRFRSSEKVDEEGKREAESEPPRFGFDGLRLMRFLVAIETGKGLNHD